MAAATCPSCRAPAITRDTGHNQLPVLWVHGVVEGSQCRVVMNIHGGSAAPECGMCGIVSGPGHVWTLWRWWPAPWWHVLINTPHRILPLFRTQHRHVCAGIRATFQHHPADIRHPDLECLFLSTTFLSGVATTANYASLISHGRGLVTAGSKLLAAAAAKSFLCRGAGTSEGDNDGNCLSSASIPRSHSLHHSSFLPTSGPTNIILKLAYIYSNVSFSGSR